MTCTARHAASVGAARAHDLELESDGEAAREFHKERARLGRDVERFGTMGRQLADARELLPLAEADGKVAGELAAGLAKGSGRWCG